MGFLSKIFGDRNVLERQNEPSMVYVTSEDEGMIAAIEKAKDTLWYFEECLVHPNPDQDYFSIKVNVKNENSSEHIWLNDPHFDEAGNLFGTVGNEPSAIEEIKVNQKIGVDREVVSDWMIVEQGRLIGGYTIRAIRAKVPHEEQQAFDEEVGLIIDKGEDHYKANFDTPEGALIMLENAYNAKDMDGALACKDFEEEAVLMLSALNGNLDEEVILKTAEVIKHAFMRHFEVNGFPNFIDVKRAFEREFTDDTHCIVTEYIYHPDGSRFYQKINTFKSGNTWKVLSPIDED